MSEGHQDIEAGQLWRHRITDEPFVPEQRLVNQDRWRDAGGNLMWEDQLREQYLLVDRDNARILDWWDGLTDEQRTEALKITGLTAPEWLASSLANAKVYVIPAGGSTTPHRGNRSSLGRSENSSANDETIEHGDSLIDDHGWGVSAPSTPYVA